MLIPKFCASLLTPSLIKEGVNNEAQNFGINIVDVRIKRADLPQANSDAIYRRMQTEREREAKEFRAKGAEMAVTITSTADKEVTVILADAEKKSQIMKGEGDGKRNKIFADAFGQDPDFFEILYFKPLSVSSMPFVNSSMLFFSASAFKISASLFSEM